MREVAREVNNSIWNLTIRFVWLNLHFLYKGKRRQNLFANLGSLERAYGYFMRDMVGMPLYFFTRSGIFFKVATYIDELLPQFLDRNPDTEPDYFAFPYETVSLDHMYLVYQLPERLNLLEIAEERKMNYNQFTDYVVNHVLSANEETDVKQYRLMRLDAPTAPPYIWHASYKPLRHRIMRIPARFKRKDHG